MLGNKEISILNYFLNHRNQYVKSSEIATALGMSDRTIRKYIKLLNDSLLNNGAVINSKQGFGFILEIQYQIEFENFIKVNIPNNINKKNMSESETRQYFILNKLIFEEKSCRVDEIADELFVSRSTVTHDLSIIRNKLIDYHLDIGSKSNKGIYINGEEIDIRHFIMDYFLGKGFFSTINKYFENSFVLNQINLEELTIIVLDETRQSNIFLSDYTLQNLVLHLGLAIKRIQEGFQLSPLSETPKFEANQIKVAENIIRRISNIYNIEFPEEEAKYIALHIMSKGQLTNKSNKKDGLSKNVKSILKMIDIDIDLNISKDRDLINGILTHLKPLLVRLENNIHLENPLLDEILDKYNDYFNLTKKYFSNLPELQDKAVNDSEWAYLSLHILAAIEKSKERNKLNALLICATGYGSAQMLKVRIQNEFKDQIRISNTISYYEIDKYNLKEIDCIISTIDLSNQVFKIPVIHVSVLLNNEDILKINSFIKQYDFKTGHLSPIIEDELKSEYFDKYFNENLFFINELKKTKLDIYNQLIEKLTLYEDEHFKEAYKRQVYYREELSSVVFSDKVAVPHPVQPIGDHSNIAVCISRSDIDFNDGSHVQIIFMLSPSKHDDTNFKQMINILVEVIDSEEITNRLINTNDFQSFKQIILENF